MKIVSVLIAILTSIATLVCSTFPLALGVQKDIAWKEYLEWEANDLEYRDTLEYAYNIIVNETQTVVYTGSYTDCYHNLSDFESNYGDCAIMPA